MELFGDEFGICPHCGYIVGSHAEEAIHIEPGTLLYDRYIIGKVLGYGGFGVTYLGWDGKLEQKVAIKEYLPSEFSTRMPGQSQVTVFNGEKNEQFHDGLKKFVEEAKHLAKFQNEDGIVKIFDSFIENDTAYIIMEYLDGETLTEYLRREKTIPEEQAVEMLMPVMESLQVVHEAGLLHRDIAPDNIFITKSGEVKLIDFGASRYATTSHSRSLTVIIKPGYSPEEQYRSRGDQGPHTDVYAIASTLYKMITGKTPPDAMERRAKYESQNKDILEEPHKINKKISLNRENAILNAMNVRVEDRTPDIATFIKDLHANPPVKRVYGKIKKIDLYSWPTWLKVTVPAVLSAVLIFGVLLLTGVINFSKDTNTIIIPENVVTVPDVEGLYKEEALKLIEQGQLLAFTDGSIESEYIPAGKIILQTPVGSSYMDVNSTVLLMVSSGKGVEPPKDGISTIPFVSWDDVEVAVSKLEQAGLAEPEIIQKHDENVAAGAVISQSVEPGIQVEEGTKITITVSLGPASFGMPNVVGQSKDKAEGTLTAKGLVVVFEYKKTDEVAEGNVVTQSVEAGKDVKRGDVITITVSSGRETIDVADVKGKKKAEAESILKEQGFKVTVLENYDSVVPVGNVVSQSPGGGTAQLPGTTIVIYVSKGKQPITVSYDANGGSVDTTSKSTYLSDAYGTLPIPIRTGYTFVGWYSAKADGVEVKADTIISTPANHTLYAIWKANSYTLSFNSNGGSKAPANKKVTYDATYGTLGTVTKTGYTFTGWYTAASGGTKVTETTKYNVVGNQTLYAQWKANTYTVNFNANGGNVSTSSVKVTYDSTYGTLPTPTRTGYTFNGWFTADSGGTKVTASTKVKLTANQTLYAQWSIIKSEVSFNGNGVTISASPITVTYNSTYGTLPTPTRTGYTFKGWFTATTGGTQITASTKVTIVAKQTLYAQWTANDVSVTFNPNGGSVSTTSAKVKFDSTYGTLPTPTRTGYTFSGWYTAASGGTKVTSTTKVTNANAHTLYAQWTVNSYTLTFDPNGGTVSPTSTKVNYGSAYGTLPTPTNPYNTFDGWYTARTGGTKVTAATVMGAGNTTIYAHWTLKSVSGWVLESNVPAGAQIISEKWTFTRTVTTESTNSSVSGYTQTGSYWKQTGSGSVYYASFPTGFDTSHSLYTSFNKSALSSYENATSKRTVSNAWAGYVYWHWMYDSGGYREKPDRAISHRSGSWNADGSSGGRTYKYFFAITSTVDCPYLDKSYCCSQNLPSYNCNSIITDRTNVGTPRCFRFDYYKNTYTDYTKIYTFKKVTNEESSTKVTAGGQISNVQRYVQYRAK